MEEQTPSHCALNKHLGQSVTLTHAPLEIAVVRPLLLTVNGPKLFEPWRHQKKLEVRFIGKIVSLIALLCLEIDQLVLIINFFSKAYEQRIRLIANTTTDQSNVAASMIPALISSNDSLVTTLSKAVLHLQHITISPHTVHEANVETSRVPLEMFEYRELLWCQDRSIPMTTVV